MKHAPIALFVYNRPIHTIRTIEALLRNHLAQDSELFVFSDGARNENSVLEVTEVRNYLKTIAGFKRVVIVEREQNFGLAKNIIEGVTSILNEYDSIIVLEDDLITSPSFLKFMNDALLFYKEHRHIWHISGWNYPVEFNISSDIFAWRVMNCSGGWATWQDRWINYEKNPEKIIKSFSRKEIRDFDLNNSGVFWPQVINNQRGKMNTWAIFWYAIIFKNHGLCINPTKSFVENIGFDGSGINSGTSIDYLNIDLNTKEDIVFEEVFEENKEAVKTIRKYYKKIYPSLFGKIRQKIIKFLNP